MTFVKTTVPGSDIELSKNLKTGEANYAYTFDPSVPDETQTLLSDRDFRFLGKHINYLFQQSLFYLWVQEPNWQDYLNTQSDIEVVEPFT
jgi:hypothetical protein